ncbi:MAG: glycosyl transferase [Gemmataceae bacterium]
MCYSWGMTDSPSTSPIVILIPVFNDWEATRLLLGKLDHELAAARLPMPIHVLLVDDASTQAAPAGYLEDLAARPAVESGEEFLRVERQSGEAATLTPTRVSSFQRIEILELRRNLGHQRAIAVGLSWIHANENCQAVVVMDGDGEDEPRDALRLIQRYLQNSHRPIVFAQRAQRSESLVFRFFYGIYRVMFRVLTGHKIDFGNFSILPFEAVDRLVAVTELWNHYASAVIKARLPFESIPTKRGVRLAGNPRMNFLSLALHGLSAIAAYGDVLGVRCLLANIGVMVAALIGIAVVVAIRLGTEMAIPGWATNAFGLLLIVLFQAIISSVLFIFIILGNRQGANFLPVRDYSYFVLRTRRLVCRP